MFDRIAPRYDLLNRTMTAGLDGRWRRAAAAAADLAAGDRALDAAAAPATSPWSSPYRTTPSGRAVGVDFAEEMVARARDKAARRWSAAEFQVADALALPFDDGAFDAATVAFGIRNVADLDAGLAEMARVVRPGGAGRVSRSPPRPTCAASTGSGSTGRSRASGGCSAATAPPTPTCRRRCAASPSRRSWPARMAAAGLTDVRWRGLAGGIVALHHGAVR